MRSPCDSGCALGAEGQRVEGLARRRSRRVAGAQQRQVVQHVELQDRERRLAAVGGDVDQVVALGLQRRFADDVEVGDDVALAGDEEARADRGLAGAALQHGADLHQLRARLLVDLARRERDRRRRRRPAGGVAGRPRRRPARRSAPAAQLRRRRRCGQRQHARRRPAPDANSHSRTILRGRIRAGCGTNVAATVVAAAAARRRRNHTETSHATTPPDPRRPRPARPASRCPRSAAPRRVEKPKLTIAVGGKNLLYYLPLTIAESARLLQGRGPRRHDRRFRRRLARAAGAGRRQRRRRLGRVRAHHQHAGQGPAPARLRAAGAGAADRPRHQPEDDAELQVGRRAEGQEARRHRAGLVDQRARQLRARQGRAEAGRRLDHRRRRRQRRGRGDALRPDRRDLQPRPGDHAAARARAT